MITQQRNQAKNRLVPARSFTRIGYFGAALLALTLPVVSAYADTLADWTFETSQPTTAGPFTAESGVNASGSAASGFHASTSTYSSPAGNGSAHSFSSTVWAINDYYQFKLSTANYSAIQLTFDQISSGSGPANFQLEYSTNGTTFVNAASGAYLVTNTAWSSSKAVTGTTYSFNLSSTSSLNGQANVYFRLVDTSTTSANGTTVATSGTDRVDNFIVSGTASTSSAFSYFDLNGATAGSGVANNSTNTFSGTHFNTALDGTGATAAFTNDGTATATFSAGTDSAANTYTVNIDTAVMTKGLAFTDANVTLAHPPGGSLTLTGASVTVATGSVATISEAIGGAVGLTKDGAGKLTLTSTTSGFTGTVTVDAGILSISADANLGTATNAVALATGTLQTTAGVSTARGFTGTGSLDIAPNTILASTGTLNTTGVTLANTGTLDLQGATPSVGNLAFSSAGTLESTTNSTVSITGLTASNLTSGTTTVSAALTYAGATSLTTTVGAGGELDVTGTIATPGLTAKGNNVFFAKQGAGTLDLYGNNTGLFRVELGSATTGTPSPAGTININNANSLGANQFFFNAGTLNATAALAGANALPIGVSLGALSNAPAVISGSNVEFTNASSIFEGTGTGALANALTINNTTVISGVLSSSTAQTTASLGLLLNGTGTLRLTGANTFTDPVAISGGVTLEAAGTGGNQGLGSTTKITANAGGTLLLSTPNQVNTAAPIILNTGAISLANGANHGSGATVSGGVASGTSAIGLGALTLSGNSTLNYLGTAATVVFTSFAPTNGGKGTYTLNLTGTNFGMAATSADGVNNRLIFDQDVQAAGYLGDITFNGVADGSEISLGGGFYEIVVPEPTTIFGGLLLLGALGWNQRRHLGGLAGVLRNARAA